MSAHVIVKPVQRSIYVTDKDFRGKHIKDLTLEEFTVWDFNIDIEMMEKADYIYYEGKKGKVVFKNKKGGRGIIHTTSIPYPTDIIFYL